MNTNKIYAESIVNEYSKKEDSKIVRLKKLDHKVKRGPNIFAYTFGVISALILGAGMCMTMGKLGPADNQLVFIIGIGVGLLGILGCALTYPIYKGMLNSAKEKNAADIIALAKEIENEETK